MARRKPKTPATPDPAQDTTNEAESTESTGQEAAVATPEPVVEPVEENLPFDPETILAGHEDGDDEFADPVSPEPAPEASETPAEGEPAEAAPVEPAEAAAEPVSPDPVPAPEPVVAEPAPAQQPPVEPQAAPAVDPALPTQTPEEAQQELNQWRDTAETQLAESRFAISEDDAALLATEPEKVLPRMAARVYMDAVLNVSNAVMQNLPSVIGNVLAQRSTQTDLEGEFFTTWPKLKADAHNDTLNRLGTAYRTAYPQATPEEFIRDVGAQAMVVDKVPFDDTPTNGVTEPGEEASIAPHPPVNSVGRPPPATPPEPDNPWATLTDDVLEEQLE